MGTLIHRALVALPYLLAASGTSLAQDRETRPPPALPSANALFLEFEDDPVGATNRYVGKALTLEGARGTVILLSDGTSAAVHISARGKPNALILRFPDRNELAGVKNGERFRFTCVIAKFEYGNLWLNDCAVANKAGPEGPRILSANALYRAFKDDEAAAAIRYVGKSVTLEGLRGNLILLGDGKSAAVHIADQGTSNALTLLFPNRTELGAVSMGQRFVFTCTVRKFEYPILWLEACLMRGALSRQ